MQQMISKKQLQDNLRSLVDYTIYQRGVDYFFSGKVKGIKVFSDVNENLIKVEGFVEGSDDYYPEFYFDLSNNNFKRLNCDCPCGFTCKHIIALGIFFINLYLEFLQKTEISSVNRKFFRNDLIDYINNRKNNSKEDDDIIDKLASIGVDVSSLPPETIDVFRKNLNISKNKIVKNPPKSYLNHYMDEDFVFGDYYLIVEFDRGFLEFAIYDKNSALRKKASDLLQIYKNKMPKLFVDLLKVIDQHSYWNLKEAEIFDLINEVKIPIYKKSRHTQNKIFLDFNPVKIKMSLYLEDYFSNVQKNNHQRLVFEIDHTYQNTLFFASEKYLIEIKKNKINLHQMSKELISLITEIELKNYYYRDDNNLFKSKLEQESLLDINDIIEKSRKYLDLDLKIPLKFLVQEKKLPKSVILIDYKKGFEKISVMPAIDYGGTFIDVSSSVYFSHAQWDGGYKLRNNNYGDQRGYFVVGVFDDKVTYAKMDEKKEITLYRQIVENHKEFGFSKTGKCLLEKSSSIENFLVNHLLKLKEAGYEIRYLNDKIDMENIDFKADFSVDLNAENDWLYFDVACYLGENKISVDDLRKFLAEGVDFLKTKEGKLLKITNKKELEKFIEMLDSFYEKANGGYEGKLYNAPELEDVFTSSQYYNTKIADSFKNFVKEAHSGKPVEKIVLPKQFQKTLRDYQKIGVDWFYFLRKYHFAGILADDMGLGKTLQTLVLLEKEKIKDKPSIVICPKTLLYNWQAEAHKFAPDLKTGVIEGSIEERTNMIKKIKNFDLLICSYSSFKNDFDRYSQTKVKFNYAVLDEAQYVKNYKTQTARAVKKVDADYRLALTGTPLENNVSEIWSIFDFLMPGFLGSNKKFVKNFQTPIMKNNNQEILHHLRKKTECFMLRRTKKEVLKELPDKIEQVSLCQLEKDQNILYQEILKNVKKEIKETVAVKGFAKSQIHILAALTKLRQVCNHPVLTLKNKDYTEYNSGKMDLCLELVDEIIDNNRKVLIFSQFTGMLDILEKEFKRKKIKTFYLSGKTKHRQELIDKFNNDDKQKVFLISLRAGGVGLNLTSADNVIIFDPWWNPSVENQAIDRTHRMGQKKTVNVYRLVTQGTIEEKILALQNKKKFLFDNLVGESRDLFAKLTWDDVLNLFE